MSESEFDLFVLLEARKYNLSKEDCRTILGLFLKVKEEMFHLAKFENMAKLIEMKHGLRITYENGLKIVPVESKQFKDYFRA